jgi:hypothetical protein
MTGRDVLAQSVSFTANPGISYGHRIIVASEPTEADGKWHMDVTCDELGLEAIEADDPMEFGESYIVIEREHVEAETYRHRAVSPEVLEKATDELFQGTASAPR